MEREPETFKPPKRYSVPNPPEGVKVKVQIMQRVKGGCIDLPGREKVSQICPRAGSACVAGTLRIGRAVVLGVPDILYVDAPLAGKQLAVPGVTGRQDAIEQVDAARHRFDEVFGRARAHEIPRPLLGQPWRGARDEV